MTIYKLLLFAFLITWFFASCEKMSFYNEDLCLEKQGKVVDKSFAYPNNYTVTVRNSCTRNDITIPVSKEVWMDRSLLGSTMNLNMKW